MSLANSASYGIIYSFIQSRTLVKWRKKSQEYFSRAPQLASTINYWDVS